MKNKKRIILSFILVIVLVIVFCTPALAAMSDYDSQYLSPAQQTDVATYIAAWNAANTAGNTAAAAAAHVAAEAVRAQANYSGGADGSQYIPMGTSGTGYGGYTGGYYPVTPTTFIISAATATGGTISPSGSTSVTSGGSQAYTITPNSGFIISSITVDGTSVGSVSTYTFSNVTSAHTISVTFASKAALSAGVITLGDNGSGTLKSGNVTKSGYGITASLPVTASYVNNTTVTASYNFTSAQSVSLEYVNGTWQFPVNTSSATGARKIYIPVATKDGTYTMTFTVKAIDPQATLLSGYNVYLTTTKSATLTIKGSMYEDDFSGNS